MRLIDADELINQGYEIVVDGWQYDTCNKSVDIDDIPTAYDVDKVVEELEKLADENYKAYCIAFNSDDRAEYDAYTNAIEIVKEMATKQDFHLDFEKGENYDFTRY